MSRSELTEAYVRGRISRRSFVRGMVALGASVTTAAAMAESLAAAPSGTPRLTGAASHDDWKKDDVYCDPYDKKCEPEEPYHPPKPYDPPTSYKPDPGTTSGGVTVAYLPSTGVAAEAGSPTSAAVVAAGAAAAAVVALRMRHGKKAGDEA